MRVPGQRAIGLEREIHSFNERLALRRWVRDRSALSSRPVHKAANLYHNQVNSHSSVAINFLWDHSDFFSVNTGFELLQTSYSVYTMF
jgi:hypothetical protein